MNAVIIEAQQRAIDYFRSQGHVLRESFPHAQPGDTLESISALVTQKVDHAEELTNSLRGARYDAPEHISEDVLSVVHDDALEAVRLLSATRDLVGLSPQAQQAVAHRIDAMVRSADVALDTPFMEFDDGSAMIPDMAIDQLLTALRNSG